MSDVYVFTTADNKLQISVQTEFLNKCPNPEKLTVKELLDTFVFKYLHNDKIPATIIVGEGMLHSVGYYEFWLNGRRMEIDNPALAEQMDIAYRKTANDIEAATRARQKIWNTYGDDALIQNHTMEFLTLFHNYLKG